LSVLVCDDIRIEVTGKEILIGVYSGAIVSPQFPFGLRSLAFRIAVERTQACKIVKFSFLNPDGTTLTGTQGVAPPLQPGEEEAKFIFELPTPMLAVAGTYKIMFSMDGPLEEVGHVNVRAPNTQEEMERAKASNKHLA
jgi:hypothetical protein